ETTLLGVIPNKFSRNDLTRPARSPAGQATSVNSLMLRELHENPSRRARMDERDSMASGTRPRRHTHELEPGRAQARDLGIDVRHLEAHVMDALAPLVEELRDRRGRVER